MTGQSKTLTIAVDGFSSCGKSTFAKMIAKELDLLYIDSGAMYRAITLWAIKNGAIQNGKPLNEEILRKLGDIEIEFRSTGNEEETHTFLNGKDVEKDIRSMEVSGLVSPVSKISEVRKKMVELQRRFAEKKSVIMDGRDIGTVVFPDADIKIFMTASPEIRAERRFKELIEKGHPVDYEEVLKNINDRDHIDQTREISPLKRAEDADLLDNSNMNPDEQMEWLFENYKEILK